METNKTTTEKITDLEEKRKKLSKELQELKRKEEQRHAVTYRRIGKLIVDDFSGLSVDEIPDNDEGAEEFVTFFLADVATRNDLKNIERATRKNIEPIMREYINGHDFGHLYSDEDGENCAEPFDLSNLLVREDDGRYHTIDLPTEIANVFTKAPQATK